MKALLDNGSPNAKGCTLLANGVGQLHSVGRAGGVFQEEFTGIFTNFR